MIRVTVWNEHRQERANVEIAHIYPDGIHGCIAGFLALCSDLLVRTATLDMDEQGLSDETLANTDVLLWWGHVAHDEVSDALATRIKARVLQGMGFVALHSAHHSKPLKLLLGTSLNLRWREHDRERLWCVLPSHPIAEGLPESFDIEQEEMYGEYFDIPTPDELVYLGWFAGGEVFRAGCTFTRGRGKIFYFQPGHEAYPVYYQPEIQRIVTNAVRWAQPRQAVGTLPGCINAVPSPECLRIR